MGVATGVPTVFISVGNSFQDGDLNGERLAVQNGKILNSNGYLGMLDAVQFLLQQDSPPQVVSTSYGGDEDGVSPALAE